ncbi:hypothetical protein ACHAXT_009309 [Thalassiosira profunda]
MARIHPPAPVFVLRAPRGGASSKKPSLGSVRRLLLLLLFALVLPLLVWLNHIVLSNAGNDNVANGEPSASLQTPPSKPIQIAYAISLIKCGDFQSSTSGLLDAATVLRHSVHATSVRTPGSGSKYDYKLYAIVHSNAKDCSHILSDLGYEVLIKDSPVQISEIKGEYLRKNVHKEWCCGADEFVKLYAYTIDEHPIVVHTDIDFMYYQPMDSLFDAMLLPHDSEEGRAARKQIEMEYPEKTIPNNIQAYLTRDYHQVIPGRKAAFQAGFIVLKPSQEVEITSAASPARNGWGGMGYGGVVGSMAMQGLPAYYYDVIRPNTTVELNGCRYNHMGANIFYEDVPNFIKRYRDLHGKCRRNVKGCEDCRKTDLSLVKNIHYTNCRKPWNCAGKSSTSKGDIDPRTTDYEHCMKVSRTWHEMRTDLEGKIANVTGDAAVLEGQTGSYKEDVFMGHCKDDGQAGYLPIVASKEIMRQVAEKVWN